MLNPIRKYKLKLKPRYAATEVLVCFEVQPHDPGYEDHEAACEILNFMEHEQEYELHNVRCNGEPFTEFNY